MIRKISAGVLLVVIGLVAFGPGWVYWRSPQVREVKITTALDQFISEKESYFQVKTGNASTVIYSLPTPQKSPYVIVYLHGFSASPKEISPVVETVAGKMKFNAYLPRLAGHGLQNGLMEELTADELFQDAEEAYQIGRQLGEKVILIGTSTGATLALWLSARHPDVAGLVLISPNLGIRDPRGFLAAGPLGYWIARTVVGPFHEWKPKHAGQEDFWTTRYSINGVRVMTDVVREVQRLNFTALQQPVLVLWTDRDSVVDVQKAVALLRTMPSEKKFFQAIDTDEHVLAGAITSPSTVLQVTGEVEKFIQNITQQTGEGAVTE